MHDDKDRGIELRERGIDLIEAANAHWIEETVGVVQRLAARRLEFTTDAIWAIVRGAPKDGRAMGAAMREVRRLAIAEPTDRTVNSVRSDCHRRPIRVWKSLIYKPQ